MANSSASRTKWSDDGTSLLAARKPRSSSSLLYGNPDGPAAELNSPRSAKRQGDTKSALQPRWDRNLLRNYNLNSAPTRYHAILTSKGSQTCNGQKEEVGRRKQAFTSGSPAYWLHFDLICLQTVDTYTDAGTVVSPCSGLDLFAPQVHPVWYENSPPFWGRRGAGEAG